MGLRETESSLRAYLLLAGIVGLMIGAVGILPAHGHGLAGWVPVISKLVEGAAFVWAGRRLRTALLAGTRGIERVLIGSGVLVFAEGAIVTAAGGSLSAFHDVFGVGWDLLTMAIGLAITIYLYRSVVRLSAEAFKRAGLPEAPPSATALP
ncbi:MAG: hypothetical protein SFX73_14485 [Kofleriaceae bacterium]|nr:hypothetical protein [Kofleriaceae bacterium]